MRFPSALRLCNALHTSLCYLGQLFWPADLCVYYPYPRVWLSLVASGLLEAVLLAGITGLWSAGRLAAVPICWSSWLWYLGTLVPVIGLVQVGSQARADRYTYVPMVGVLLMLVWSLRDLLAASRSLAGTLAAAVLLACVPADPPPGGLLGQQPGSVAASSRR